MTMTDMNDRKNRLLGLLPMLGALLAVTGGLTWGDLWAQRHFNLIGQSLPRPHGTPSGEDWRQVLDFTADPVPGPQPGLVVTSVRSRGHAEKAGLVVGDWIERADGREPPTLQALAEELSARGQRPIHLTVVHQGAVRTIDLVREPELTAP
ncbi:MAG: PDZ domain-containing protein [Novosphingobium sp.]|nr:PDZ domain-containing protein [Novosphingobium sp.]